MSLSLHGIHLPHRKSTKNKPVVRMDPPTTVTLPMATHIGAPSIPLVKVGDTVKVGTKVAEAGGRISTPIYASVSGKVTKIADYLLYGGSVAPAIVIESDGNMTPDDTLTPPVIHSREELIAAIRESGIVGLGGAGFPTHVKLDVDPDRIEYLIVNGAECEPYVTSDSVTMIHRRREIALALSALREHLGIKKIIIGIESDKKEAIASMKQLMAENAEGCQIRVKVLSSVYPQGGEKVLIYHTTGRAVPEGKLPIDVGCIVVNCTTLAAIGTYLETGMPLVEKCVTVDGGAVKNPQNVIVPIGTSLADVFAFCGGFSTDPAKVIYGGPMMGVTIPDTDAPILKNTNAILALTAAEAKHPKTTACIRCGRCTNTCPFGLSATSILQAFQKRDLDTLATLNVFTCMECGCCSYICPANRPLVQTVKLAKRWIREEQAKEEKKA